MNIPRPWTRHLRRVAYALAALVCLDLLLRTEWVERPAARLLETGIELATGERAVVGSVDFKPATGAIKFKGLFSATSWNRTRPRQSWRSVSWLTAGAPV